MDLGRYSIGMGDRFGRQGPAQLRAVLLARHQGVDVTPVWNKSWREHSLIGTLPPDVRREADAAVRAAGWTDPYFVDADHINLKTVDAFVEASDFFTLDVAEAIGQPPDPSDAAAFVASQARLLGSHRLPVLGETLTLTRADLGAAAGTFLRAVREAGRIYRHIAARRGGAGFVAEVSMDETAAPQSPADLLVILAALAAEGVPVRTLAPRFSGRFNKGVDYVGDVAQFSVEFRRDLAVVRLAVETLGLPPTLKLSVHSGSDKFSLYGPIREALREFDAGLHLKTAGTTWLEEVAGLALAGPDGIALARQIYARAYSRADELCAPYAAVIDVDRRKLPSPAEVASWTGPRFAAALQHNPAARDFNPHLRQLIHVGYKVAAEMGSVFSSALNAHAATIGEQVTRNLYERHLRPLFIG